MTSDRARAYGRVMKLLSDLSAAKFQPHEQDLIRDAADALFFCEDLAGDEAALDALEALRGLRDRLVESDRLLPETADRLVADVEACGPLAPVAG